MTVLTRTLVAASALALAVGATPSAAVTIPWAPQTSDTFDPYNFNNANMTFAGVNANTLTFSTGSDLHSHGGLVNWSITATIDGTLQTIYSSTVNNGNTLSLSNLGTFTFLGGNVTSIGFTSSPGQNQTYHFTQGMTFTLGQAAVPEPATWAMMLVGFGGIGFAMRRQRKAPQLAHAA